MALSIKIDPVERFTQVTIRDDLSAVAKGDDIAAFVREGIAEGDAANQRVLGRVPPRTITVDGRENAPLESVNPDGGNIVVEWDLIGDLLVWIGDTLVARSPHVSGDYQRGWTLFADGAEVPLRGQVPEASKFVFVNLVPYSRKIEIGKTESGRDFVIQVPNRIAERTAKDANSRFGNQAKIVFGYESVQGGGAVGRWAQTPSALRHASRHHRRSGVHDWLTRQPAVIVYTK